VSRGGPAGTLSLALVRDIIERELATAAAEAAQEATP
jgi:hypothetical protein